MRLVPVCSLLVLLSCTDGVRGPTTQNTVFVEPPKKVLVQPLGSVKQADIDFIVGKLAQYCPGVEVLPAQKHPAMAWYAPRGRFRADSLIAMFGRSTPKTAVTLVLLEEDISHTRSKDVPDFGIMGLAFKLGNACIASPYRLSKQHKKEQWFKVAIHELAHTTGLPHCETADCFLHDAGGKNITDRLTSFCKTCKQHLEECGWIL